MLTVWGRTNSVNVQKVMWAVAELGLEHERIDAGGAFGGLDTPEYGAMNPNRKIPTVRDGDGRGLGVERLRALPGGPLRAGLALPGGPGEAGARRRLDGLAARHAPARPVPDLLEPDPHARGAPGHGAVQAAAGRIARTWQILDDHLASQPFVAGDGLTMGDVPVGCAYWRYINLDVERPGLPNCEIWFRALKERDGYRRHVMLPVT
jgi:glutathione S-transferase